MKKVGNNPKASSDPYKNLTIRPRVSENPLVKVSNSYKQKCDFFPKERSQKDIYYFILKMFTTHTTTVAT